MNNQSKLQELRIKKGLSQSELSKLSGVNFRTLQDFDQGRKSLANAKGEMIYRLSTALDCTTDYLIQNSLSDIIDTSIKVNKSNHLRKYYNMVANYNMITSKSLSRAKICFEHATSDYNKIYDDDCYLDSCCFHLQQCVEFLLKGIVELNGLQYAENHDIRANLNILNRASITIPREKELRLMSDILYKWETESRYKDSFIAAIKDIDEIMEYATELLIYVYKQIESIIVEEIPFPDKRLTE